jgi:hypothetical protein
MPLPLPNLDTRRWEDLVEEGRALIPRYAPEWTDHNVHDPGITLMELFAYLVEQDIFRLNQIPARHRRKFLALAGFLPLPPRPAQTTLALKLAAGESGQTLPAGVVFAAGELRFRTLRALNVVPASIRRVYVFDGAQLVDQTRLWRDRLAFPLFGSDPQPGTDEDEQPAFYLGLDAPLPVGDPVTLGLWFGSSAAGSEASLDERTRLLEFQGRLRDACRPRHPDWPCDDEEDDGQPAEIEATGDDELAANTLPPHHSVRTMWEFYDGADWRALDPEAGEIDDDTYGLTFDGAVHITLPAPMGEFTINDAPASPTLRCRLIDGPPDAAPILRHIALNAVPVEQAIRARAAYVINPGVQPPPGDEPQPGQLQRLRFSMDEHDRLMALDSHPDAPATLGLAYTPASDDDPGELVIELAPIGRGTGAPHQIITLRDAPVAGGLADVWSVEPGSAGDRFVNWHPRPDLDASARDDTHFTLDATTGDLRFGEGERGRVPPRGAALLARFSRTAGAAGNVRASADWTLPDDLRNHALLGEDVAAVAARLDLVENPVAASGGSDQETLNHAAGRAAESLWAHERLVELCEQACHTLDQLDRARVMSRRAPGRAVNLLDFERLALSVPGIRIARARAWAGIDPDYPCLQAPGTVTVVVVPFLPRSRPYPTAGLLGIVRDYLDFYRVIGTRLVVAAPDYVTVRVRAAVRSRTGANPERVRESIRAALDAFLHPLTGGPNGRGWPFGRDVYRAEILQTIDNVPGVDHVLSLELLAGDDDGDCGNVCVGPLSLVTTGQHEIEIE